MNIYAHLALWLRCMICWLFFLYEGVQISSFNALLPALMNDLQLSGMQISFISSCYFYTVVLLLIPAGIILEYFSVKKIFLLAMAFSVTATLIFSFSYSFTFAVFAKLLAGVGASTALIGNLKINSFLLPKQMLARGISGVIMFGMIGDIIGQLPVNYLISHVGWRMTVLTMSVIGYGILLLNIVNLLTLPTFKSSHSVSLSVSKVLTDIKQVLKNTQTWLAGYFIFCFDMPVMILGTLWGQMYLMQVFHCSAVESGTISTMLFLGVIVGSPILGHYIDNAMSLKKMMVFGVVLTFILVSCLIMLKNSTFICLLLLFFGIGFFSTVQIAGYSIIHQNTPAHLHAIACSVASVLMMGLGALSRNVFSWLIQLGWDGKELAGVAIYAYEQYRNGLMAFLFCFILGFLTIKAFSFQTESSTFPSFIPSPESGEG